MATHTPGPWRLVENDRYGWRVEAGSLADDTQENICVPCYGRPGKLDEANARLIAAAPELLEALTEATGRYEGTMKALLDVGTVSQQYYDESMAIARPWIALLAKIEAQP